MRTCCSASKAWTFASDASNTGTPSKGDHSFFPATSVLLLAAGLFSPYVITRARRAIILPGDGIADMLLRNLLLLADSWRPGEMAAAGGVRELVELREMRLV